MSLSFGGTVVSPCVRTAMLTLRLFKYGTANHLLVCWNIARRPRDRKTQTTEHNTRHVAPVIEFCPLETGEAWNLPSMFCFPFGPYHLLRNHATQHLDRRTARCTMNESRDTPHVPPCLFMRFFATALNCSLCLLSLRFRSFALTRALLWYFFNAFRALGDKSLTPRSAWSRLRPSVGGVGSRVSVSSCGTTRCKAE